MSTKSIFDYINDIFLHKPDWEEYSDQEKKGFSIYMLNRWISMNIDYLEFINFLQRYSLSGLLSSKTVYKLYIDLLPKTKFFAKYVSKDKGESKIKEELLSHLTSDFNWSRQEAVNCLSLISSEYISSYLKDKGLTDSEIKKIMK